MSNGLDLRNARRPCDLAFSIMHLAFLRVNYVIIFVELMNFPVTDWSLIAVTLLLAALLLLDFAFGVEPAVYAAFLPALLWAVVVGARGRAAR